MFGTFLTITGDMVASTTGYMRDMINDTSPIWIIIVGIGAGLIIFEVIVHAIRGRQ
jgi:F0F1-type ATP synthase assembly protein I